MGIAATAAKAPDALASAASAARRLLQVPFGLGRLTPSSPGLAGSKTTPSRPMSTAHDPRSRVRVASWWPVKHAAGWAVDAQTTPAG